MSVKDSIIKLLADRGLEMLDDSEFTRGNERKPISKGNVAVRYFARRAKEPNKGLRVSIKVIMRPIAVSVEGSQIGDMDYVRERTWQYYQRECCISKRGEGHPNIQTCLGIINRFEGVNLTLPGLVFKDVAVGDLQTFVLMPSGNPATNATKVKLMRDVADALAFLHERKIVHRDIKCCNILVDSRDGHPVALLSDFGSAKDFGDLVRLDDSTIHASSQWLAPELFKKPERIHDFEYGASGDMWAFGCTMIEVLAVTRLVWSTGEKEDIQYALNRTERPPRPSSFPPWEDAWMFIHDRCLNTVPNERITSRQAVEELVKLLETVPTT